MLIDHFREIMNVLKVNYAQAECHAPIDPSTIHVKGIMETERVGGTLTVQSFHNLILVIRDLEF